MFEKQNEVIIRAETLEQSNLAGFDRLELHCLDHVAAVIPGEMTAMELISASEALQKLAADLLLVLLQACSACDNCGQEEPCELMGECAMSEGSDSKGEEPFGTSSAGEFFDIADSLDFEDQPTDFDDGHVLSDISSDMLHFGDVVDAVQHSRRDQPLNRLLPKRHESRGWRHCQGTESNHRRASGMSGKYDDIIHLPHPTSKKHPRMSIRDRAAIFSPFAALSGHGAAIAETARLTDRRMELDQRQAVLLEHIEEQPEVSVTWFRPDERKDGGAYATVTGRLKKIDETERTLTLLVGTSIPLEDVVGLESELLQGIF